MCEHSEVVGGVFLQCVANGSDYVEEQCFKNLLYQIELPCSL